jgi:hypothetical protein
VRSLWSLLAALVAFIPAERATAQAASSDAASGEPAPIVLELFTSQGCSSCPRADQLLSRLGLDDATRALVVPLAFHVDYWNRIGWTDPWSAPAWSQRQDAYCRALEVAAGPYTPQLVVHGQAELNGSQEQRLLAELQLARAQPAPARVELAVSRADGGKPVLRVKVGAEVTRATGARTLELLVAVFENGLVTAVERGENRGLSLHDDFVVRRLEKAFSLVPDPGAHRERELELRLKRGVRVENMGVAAFLQDPDSMRIHAATSVRLGPRALVGGLNDGRQTADH